MQVRRNDKLRLLARGPDADAALAAFQALAADNFGESPAAQPAAAPATPERVEGAALRYPLALIQPLRPAAADAAREQQRLRRAIDQTLADLIALTELAENKFHADIAAISPGTTPFSTMTICLMPPTIACSPNNARRNGHGIRC